MRKLFDTPFFVCVRECIKTSEVPVPETLLAHYGDYATVFTATVEKERSILALFRYLRLAHIEICSYYKQMEVCGVKKSSLLVTLLWKALGLVEVELDVVRLKIKHYGLAPAAGAGGEIPVFWSKKYTVSDLMELIVALYESGVLVYRDGSRVSLAALVRLFGNTFNTEIKEPRKLKSKVTTRKIRAVKFLDVLSANYIELCNG